MFFYNQLKISELELNKHYYLLSENSKSQVKIEGIVSLQEIIKYVPETENEYEQFKLELNYIDGCCHRSFIISDEDEYHIGKGYPMNYFFFKNIEDINQVILYYLDSQLSSTIRCNRSLKKQYKIYLGKEAHNPLIIYSNDNQTKTIYLIRSEIAEDLIIDYFEYSSNHIFIKDKYMPKNLDERELYIEQLINYISNDLNNNIVVIFSNCDVVYNYLKNSDFYGTIFDGFDVNDIDKLYTKKWELEVKS